MPHRRPHLLRCRSAAGARLTDADRAIAVEPSGSGIEPPVDPRVRRAFWWLERVAPVIGSRWAVELWCTPPVMESSLRMPPGVGPGERLEAYWNGHRIAG